MQYKYHSEYTEDVKVKITSYLAEFAKSFNDLMKKTSVFLDQWESEENYKGTKIQITHPIYSIDNILEEITPLYIDVHLIFIYFSLREILQSKSFKPEIQYNMTLNGYCLRDYTKPDLISFLSYIHEQPLNPIIFQFEESKFERCPEIENIDPHIINLFEEMITDYKKYIQPSIKEYFSYVEDMNIYKESCHFFALEHLNNQSFSPQSWFMVYDSCINIGIWSLEISKCISSNTCETFGL